MTKLSKKAPNLTLQDYKNGLDIKFQELLSIDAEDQASRKTADLIIRTAEQVKNFYDARFRQEMLDMKRGKMIDAIEQDTFKNHKQLNS
jgi:hypothetical protein